MEHTRNIVMQAVDNPFSVQALLLQQLALNPKGFKFSKKAIAKIEKQTDLFKKMWFAAKFAKAENIISD